MSAGAAPFARADAYPRARGNGVALALIFGVHLLAAWLWLQARRAPPRVPDAGPAPTVLLRPAAAEPAAAPEQSVPAPRFDGNLPPLPDLSSDRVRDTVSPKAPPEDTQAASSGAPAPAASPPASTPSADQAAAADTDATVPAQPAPGDGAAAARQADGGFMASLGRRQAGRLDRDLRGAKSGVPTEADTPWARFQRGLEAAHVERSMSAHLDSYTSPDGVVIYRRRVGPRTVCYRTGSVGLNVAGGRGINDAGAIPCPSHAEWKREE